MDYTLDSDEGKGSARADSSGKRKVLTPLIRARFSMFGCELRSCSGVNLVMRPTFCHGTEVSKDSAHM